MGIAYKSAAIALSSSLAWSGGPLVANAAETSAPEISSSAVTAESDWMNHPEIPSGLEVLAPYVRVTSEGYVLHAPASVKNRVDPTMMRELESYWKTVRQLAHSGSIRLSDTQSTNTYSGGVTVSWRPFRPPTWRGPHGHIKLHWFGLEVGVDAYLRDKIAGGMQLGTVATLIGGGPWGTAVATVLLAGTGLLYVCKHSNDWSYIYFVGIGIVSLTGSPVCNPFG